MSFTYENLNLNFICQPSIAIIAATDFDFIHQPFITITATTDVDPLLLPRHIHCRIHLLIIIVIVVIELKDFAFQSPIVSIFQATFGGPFLRLQVFIRQTTPS